MKSSSSVPARGRLLGLDYGTKRVGLALSNIDQTIATPLETYLRRDERQDERYLQKQVQEHGVAGLVVGLPVHMSGDEGEKAREARLEKAPREGAHPMVLMLASIKGVGLETAEMLVAEVLSRKLRDRRAVARYGGLTGSPDESGSRSREKGLARSGNARVRRGMIQLAWRFLMFQKESALAKWFEARTANGPRGVRKTMIVALARKLLIDLWRFVEDGTMLVGVELFDSRA